MTVGRLFFLHLWATWCEPCKEELGLWRELGERLDKQYGYEVKIIHIAMQRDAKEMAGFVKEMGNKMPAGARFVDRDERLSKLLQPALKRDPRLPMTLWLGPARTVKQALVGTISDRVSEVMESWNLRSSSSGSSST
jgi:thiol-disulfide isomerase/thioredoxin